jgi:hypothetical protein
VTVRTDEAGASTGNGARPPIGEFLRERQEEVLSRWQAAVRECASASRLSEPEVEDHLPLLLRQTVDAVEAIVAQRWASVPTEGSERHALTRLAEGFELEDLLTELFLLRHVLLEFVRQYRPQGRRVEDAQVAAWAIDFGIRASTATFMRAKHRRLHAVDQLSTLSIESRSLDALFSGLLAVVLETAPDVHSVALFLLDGDELWVACTRCRAGSRRP